MYSKSSWEINERMLRKQTRREKEMFFEIEIAKQNVRGLENKEMCRKPKQYRIKPCGSANL